MSTSSAIIAPTADGKFRGVYCHSDGYLRSPHGVGSILFTHYSGMVRMPSGWKLHAGRGKLAARKVDGLLDLGGISSLGTSVGLRAPRVPFSVSDRAFDGTVAYRRDFGDLCGPYSKALTRKTFTAVLAKISYDYAYLFRDGRWLWRHRHSSLSPFGFVTITPNDLIK